MGVLTADAERTATEPDIRAYPVKDNVKIYKGTLVCIDTTGYATIGADTASFVCVGVAMEQADNTVVGHTSGGINVRCRSGVHVTFPTTGAAQTSVGAAAYVADSGAVGLTATNYVVVGIVSRYNSSTSVDVLVNPAPGSVSGVAGLTSTAGELNVLHSVTPGTSKASAAAVLGANKNLDILALPVSGLKIGAAAGTAVDSTAAELNTLNGVVAGTASASKAAVLGASKNLDRLLITGLALGAPATPAYGANVTIDVTKSFHRIAGANGTSATANYNASATGADGDVLIIETTSTAAGTCTITFATNFKSSGTLAVTLSHFASVTFISDGTNWKEVTRSLINAS